MIGPTEQMVIMIIMLVVVFFGGSGPGPRPPSMRRLQPRLGNRRPLFGRFCPNTGVGVCAHTPFCYNQILCQYARAALPRPGSYATILCISYEIQDTSQDFESFNVC